VKIDAVKTESSTRFGADPDGFCPYESTLLTSRWNDSGSD
jgi:hypothetical protein